MIFPQTRLLSATCHLGSCCLYPLIIIIIIIHWASLDFDASQTRAQDSRALGIRYIRLWVYVLGRSTRLVPMSRILHSFHLRLLRFPSTHAAEIAACFAPGFSKIANIKYIIIVALIPDGFVAMEFCEGENHARILFPGLSPDN